MTYRLQGTCFTAMLQQLHLSIEMIDAKISAGMGVSNKKTESLVQNFNIFKLSFHWRRCDVFRFVIPTDVGSDLDQQTPFATNKLQPHTQSSNMTRYLPKEPWSVVGIAAGRSRGSVFHASSFFKTQPLLVLLQRLSDSAHRRITGPQVQSTPALGRAFQHQPNASSLLVFSHLRKVIGNNLELADLKLVSVSRLRQP